ncbi:imidazole glycerol phosphate synthase subunit HisF [Jeotgalicoccus coquinae]|uniref:Imidazole glycerol phosphate synthase subunit HisF n=3 Tax=Staphylococcaceae TaxID=90964 RepID=A0A078M5Y5_9STAP|nr:cyclase [Jeotgalicoccus coquinae]GGE20236.1 imidazole glycerol phosphate synthase subunit HisF [Jeotgalicoccus coquinae]CAD2071616.1 Imidazole glycerol phosphate synthase subunit HisF [Jeotgalicoccus coquinae]CEA01675.1 Imidazole glycerol phosphate synthase subunit HisF [Jeotgalicoccus saudimassiliensis]
MQKKIIPCLDVKDGAVVKGVNFVDLQHIGKPAELAERYNEEGADELVFLDISKTQEGHALMLDAIRETASVLSIPLTIGGGIKTKDDIKQLLEAGADKVSINSAALSNPEFIREAAEEFGSESIVIAVDVKFSNDLEDYYVYTHGGTKRADKKAAEWIAECEQLGAGALLITSMDHDGVKSGFDLEFLEQAADMVSIPVIASGGAGSIGHFKDLFGRTKVAAGLAASIFHREEVQIGELKQALADDGFEVRVQ